MEDEFTDYHKDSFVFGKPEKETPKKVTPKKPIPVKKEGDNAKLDDYVPEKVGDVVDNVFGKLDNLVNDAADYLFGSKKKPGGGLATPQKDAPTVPPLAPRAPDPVPQPNLKQTQVQVPQAPTAPTAPQKPQKPVTPAPVAKKAAPKQRIQTLSTLQSSRQPAMIQGVMPESKTHHKGPVISRTTAISELDLPLEILDDPDLSRYFDQMKLYEYQVTDGGMCNLPLEEALARLKDGHWKHRFRVRFEDLKKVDPGIYPLEMARSRFNGMRPVYKAMGGYFATQELLTKAIEEDINTYLKGKESKHFHPFIYQVVQSRR